MKLCESHWSRLKEGIEARGMVLLISEHGRELAAKLKTMSKEGRDTKETFDPLVGATMLIYQNAIRAFGVEILAIAAPGKPDLCPVCHLKSDDWIDKACDGVKVYVDTLPDK
jgi:hypothetical protein